MIENDVYSLLKERTEQAAAVSTNLSAVNAEIKSGRYTSEALKEYYDKQSDLRGKLNSIVEGADRDARQLVAAYQDKLRDEDCLDPKELTDDVKLLSSGLPLLPRDLKMILERNKGNRTMLQLTLRYAKQHDIDLGTYYTGNEQKIKDANNLLTTIGLYTSHWMKENNAATMLDRFFVG